MKNIHIILLLMLGLFLGMVSCTKEELRINNNELVLNENSPEYQVYLAERAMQFIRSYRFYEMGNTLDKITDPAVKKNLTDSLTKYRSIAADNAIYFINEKNDSIFVFLGLENPLERTAAGASFFSSQYMIYPNVDAPLYGFDRFPKLEYIGCSDGLATGLEGLDKLPELKNVSLLRDPDLFRTRYPTREFEFIPIKMDLSKNLKLEKLWLRNYDISNIIFPDNKVDLLELEGGLIPSEGLNHIKAKRVLFTSDYRFAPYIVFDNNMVVKNNNVDTLYFQKDGTDPRPGTESLYFSGLKTLDVKETELKNLVVSFNSNNSMKSAAEGNAIEEVLVNEGLLSLSLNSKALKEPVSFPSSLQKMELANYLFGADLSGLNQLKTLGVYYSTNYDYEFDAAKWQFPISLEQLDIIGTVNKDIDFTALTHLKSISFKAEGYLVIASLNAEIKLPATIEKVDINGYKLAPPSGTVDFSNLTNLKSFWINLVTGSAAGQQPITLILPPNLTEQALITGRDAYGSGWKPIRLKTASTIVNKQSWMDDYIEFY